MTHTARAMKPLAPGLIAVGVLAYAATWVSTMPALQALSISPLIVGLIAGVVLANVMASRIPSSWDDGVTFTAKRILRLAIILYGFRITFGQVAGVGLGGFLLDVVMVTSTLTLGTLAGTRLLGMDKETAILTSSGAAICGAAAVVATEPVVRAETHKTAVATGTVVLFGTLAMFLYPLAFRAGLVPMSEDVFGVYIGATVHEVAHVVGAGNAVSGVTSNTAVIVKMTRVLFLAPALLVLGWVLSRWSGKDEDGDSRPLTIPWFAFGFILVAGINSLGWIPQSVVDQINVTDTFLLTMAMTALGLSTVFAKLKGIGWAPVLLALGLFVWLVFGGYGLTLLFMGTGQPA